MAHLFPEPSAADLQVIFSSDLPRLAALREQFLLEEAPSLP